MTASSEPRAAAATMTAASEPRAAAATMTAASEPRAAAATAGASSPRARVAAALAGVDAGAAEACRSVVDRILGAPAEPRYRRLNVSSRSFAARLGEAGDLLAALGFAPGADGDLRVDDVAALVAAAPLLRAAAAGEPPAPPHADAPPQKLPDDVLRFQVAAWLAPPWDAAGGSAPLALADALGADAACRAWRRALAPLYGGRRLLACRRLGARLALRREWRAFEHFGPRRLRGDLADPASPARVARCERALGGPLPLAYRLSVLHHHDGQRAGHFYNGARLLSCEEAVAEACHAPPGWLPVAARVGAFQLAVHRPTGEVALLAGTTVGKRLGASWTAFLKLV